VAVGCECKGCFKRNVWLTMRCSIAWLLVALAPSEVVLDGKAGQGWAIFVH
jgi:hypothetical protein